MNEGLQERQALEQSGFTSDEIESWETETRTTLISSGFNQQEADEYFGIKNPDMTPVKEMFKKNLANYQPKEADGILEAMDAGWQSSVSGLIARGDRPSTVLPEDAGTMARIASQVATLAGDVPAMVAGAFAGGSAGAAVGSAVPVVGTVVGGGLGAGAGGNALPAAMRKVLMDHYEKGDIQDFDDFWERTSSTFLEASKEAVIGAATFGVGGKVAGAVAKVGAPVFVKSAAVASSEIATMVTLGKGFQGEAPQLSDFTDAGIVIAGLTGATKVASKLRGIYTETGIKPTKLVEMMEDSATLKQEILSENIQIPKALEPFRELLGNESGQVSPPPVVDAPPVARSESETAILSKIGEQPDAIKKPYTRDDFYTDFVDKLDPIARGVRELNALPKIDEAPLIKSEFTSDFTPSNEIKIPAADNSYVLSRMANDYKSKVMHVVEKGMIDHKTLEVTGRSLKEITAPFKEDMNGLKAYLVSKRAVELEGRGIQSGFDKDAAAKVVAEGSAKYEAAANELVEFQNGALKYLKDSGVISESALASMVEANKAYIPFSRVMDAAEPGKGKGKASSLKRIKGSERSIQDPLLSVVQNMEVLFKAAERNRAVEAFVRQAEKAEGQTLIKKVPGKMAPIEIKADEVAKMFAEQGIDADPQAFTVFRSQKNRLAPDEFEVFRNGKREVYKAPLELAQAFHSLDGDTTSMNIVGKIFKGITTIKKIGITTNPDFVVKNFFRDQLTAAAFSESKNMKPWTAAMETMAAVKDVYGKSDAYYTWLKSGGAGGSFLELDMNYLNKDVFQLSERTGFMDKVANVAKTPLELLAVTASITEQATRLAEFKRVNAGSADPSRIMDAGYAAREITVDFQRVGAKTAAMNSITAFMNVSVQGFDRSMRALKENPGGVAAKAGMYITAPSLLLWWANKDDERYKEIPRWQKDLFWIIPTDKWEPIDAESAGGMPGHLIRKNEKGGFEVNNGTIFRLPKPQELGILFGSLPERLAEQFLTDNPKAMNDFNETLIEMITPSFMPDALAPMFEQYNNKSMFTSRPIVPGPLEKFSSPLQYTEYTSDTAKSLGKILGAMPGIGSMGPEGTQLDSPMVLENYIRSWGGQWGGYALQIADKGLQKAGVYPDPVKPASALADIPFVKAFVVRYPSATAQSIVDFQSSFKENAKYVADIKEWGKRGEMDKMVALLEDQDNQYKLIQLDGIDKMLADQNKLIRDIYKNPEQTPDDKRQLIDSIYGRMIEVAKSGNQMLNEIKVEMKKAEKR